MTKDLLMRLERDEQRGSKPRCHLLTHGSPELVSERLSQLAQPWGSVDTTDRWMPMGFTVTTEAQFGRVGNIVDLAKGKTLINWWLAVPRGRASVPHWDIASTCTVGGQPGLLLIEAKAHYDELIREEVGKKRTRNESPGQIRNHEQIRDRMQQSSMDFARSTNMQWALSVEHHYQMSNRFAWAWKLTELSLPVILVYLGFLDASEMPKPFINHEEWHQLVISHSKSLFPSTIWNRRWWVNNRAFVPVIRSQELSLDVELV